MHYPITRKTSGIWLVRIPIFLHFFIAAVQFRKNNVKSKANIKIILKMFNLSLEKLTFAFFVFLIKLFLRISSKEDTWLWKMLSFHKNPPFILEIFNCKYFLLPLFFPLLATVEFTEEAPSFFPFQQLSNLQKKQVEGITLSLWCYHVSKLGFKIVQYLEKERRYDTETTLIHRIL